MASSDQAREWVPRILDLPALLARRSHLLLGPRQTGKTSLIRTTLKDAKVYDLLDTSVYLALATVQGRTFRPGTPEFGEAVETLLMHELLSYRDYTSGEALGYWRSTSGFEVDFIIGDHTDVEVKAKKTISAQDVKSLRALAEEKKLKRYLCVYLEPRTRKVDGISIRPFTIFLEALWGGEYR